jgi:alanyl-tRNA synthetase
MSMANSVPKIPDTAPAKWPQPENWPAAKVRQTYIEYFQKTEGFEHTFWPSSGVIPFDDDTLLFANAVSLVGQAVGVDGGAVGWGCWKLRCK